ncbi:unnamed protein product [Blepharisma stoltei]|uniref:Peptidase S59 domain-containing protein n=1 Tax=Blepharisma stoltei TaxID=1481888 RepID=A0AAU9J9B4_9CILI|nr:unnamed protein product [Blepharisma stoltei]
MNFQKPNSFQQFGQTDPSGFHSGFSNSYASQPFSSGFTKPPQGGFGIPSATPVSTSSTSFSNPHFTQSQPFNSNPPQPSGFSQAQFQNAGTQQPFGAQPAPLFSSPMNVAGSPMKGFQSSFQQNSPAMNNSANGTKSTRYREDSSTETHIGITSISGLDEFQNRSIEELRFEDYKFNDGYIRNTQTGVYPIISQPPPFSGATSSFGGIRSALKTANTFPNVSGAAPTSNTANISNFGGNIPQNQWNSNGSFSAGTQQNSVQSIFSQTSTSNTTVGSSSGSSISGGASSIWQTQTQNSLFSQPNPLFPQTTGQQTFSQASNIGSMSSQAPNKSLFGNINNAPTQQIVIQPIMQASLFGSINPPQAPLFPTNIQQSNPQPSSLFGANSSNSQFAGASISSLSSSLFANPQQQAPYYNPPQQTQASLFSSAQPMGGNLFPNNPQKPAGLFAPTQPNLSQAQIPHMDALLTAFKDPQGLLSIFSYNSLEEIVSSYKRDTDLFKLPKKTSLISRFSDTPKLSHDSDFNKWRQNIDRRSLTPKLKWEPSRFSPILDRKERYVITKKSSFEKLRLEEYEGEDNSKYFKAVSSSSDSPKRVKTTEIIATTYNPYPIRMAITVISTTTIQEIKYKVFKKLEWVEMSRIQLTFKSKILQDSDTIKSLSMIHHDAIDVIVTQEPQEPKETFAPVDLLPKLKRPEYFTTPSMIEIARMTTEEIKSIKNFTIENKFGKIVFDGETNMTGLNLDEIVEIQQNEINVYPNDQDKPKIGEGLNKPATIYLFNCVAKKNKTDNEFRKKLKGIADIEFVNWDRISKIWVFKVKHF